MEVQCHRTELLLGDSGYCVHSEDVCADMD